MKNVKKRKQNTSRPHTGNRRQSNQTSKRSAEIPHFRRYNNEEGPSGRKSRHPKLIISEKQNDYEFLGLTESKKRGHHNNFPLLENPKKGEKEMPAYLREEVRQAPKNRFGEPLKNYSLSEVDKPRVSAFIEKLLGMKNKKEKR